MRDIGFNEFLSKLNISVTSGCIARTRTSLSHSLALGCAVQQRRVPRINADGGRSRFFSATLRNSVDDLYYKLTIERNRFSTISIYFRDVRKLDFPPSTSLS
jgi:hypothetical protein